MCHLLACAESGKGRVCPGRSPPPPCERTSQQLIGDRNELHQHYNEQIKDLLVCYLFILQGAGKHTCCCCCFGAVLVHLYLYFLHNLRDAQLFVS